MSDVALFSKVKKHNRYQQTYQGKTTEFAATGYSPITSYHSSLTINHSSRIGCPVVLVGCNGLCSCIQARTTGDVPRLSLQFGHNVCRYSSETFRCRCIEAAVLATEGTEAALLDEQVEVLRGKVGGALADGLHL